MWEKQRCRNGFDKPVQRRLRSCRRQKDRRNLERRIKGILEEEEKKILL